MTITIRRHFSRPSATQLQRFAGMPSGWVVDARGRRGALDHRIRPLLAGTPFVGSALTVATVARDNLVPYAALQEAQPGDVLMIATGDYERAAVVGDLLVGMAKNCGIVAVVTDGLVRDIAGLEDVGIPVYARGLTPNSPEKHGPGEIGLPIALGGGAINAGDLIVGDRDGIVVVPYADIDRVADGLAAVTAKEQKMEAAVRDGLKYPEWLEQTLQQKGVRYLDEQ
jgi:4-hydroxy-4-methyl-2-oxoglutarate aldolase